MPARVPFAMLTASERRTLALTAPRDETTSPSDRAVASAALRIIQEQSDRLARVFTAGLLDAFGVPQGFVVMPIYHFVDCLLEGRQPVVTAEDGLAATQIIEAMVRSIEELRTVSIQEI